MPPTCHIDSHALCSPYAPFFQGLWFHEHHQVFELSEIRDRLLTEEDDLIRYQDTPERLQLAASTLTHSVVRTLHPFRSY